MPIVLFSFKIFILKSEFSRLRASVSILSSAIIKLSPLKSSVNFSMMLRNATKSLFSTYLDSSRGVSNLPRSKSRSSTVPLLDLLLFSKLSNST